MRELTVFVGGSLGSDPYSPNTWSGSSKSLIETLSTASLLDKAVGLKLPRLQNYGYLAKNFTVNRTVWRKHFYFDPAYRRALTLTARAVPVDSPVCFQIGHMFSLPTVFPSKKCVSYHDGNLPELLNSGFGMEGVSRQRIDQALRYEEEAAQQMTAVFTFSEYLRQSFIHDYRVPPERVFQVGGAVNLAEIPSATLNKDYSLNRLLFIGTEFNRKGGPQLLEAFRIVRQTIPTAELHIVGPHTFDNLPPGVIFHGHLSKANPAQCAKLEVLFRTSTLFVLPSLYEPFGIAPLEAMLYQLPAVVTNAWALRECVTPGINGDLTEKANAEDLATKITQLLSDPARLASMGKQAREIVLTRYTWPTVVNRISVAIKSL
jgi:alpha-maltose-1-phosphate synthase